MYLKWYKNIRRIKLRLKGLFSLTLFHYIYISISIETAIWSPTVNHRTKATMNTRNTYWKTDSIWLKIIKMINRTQWAPIWSPHSESSHQSNNEYKEHILENRLKIIKMINRTQWAPIWSPHSDEQEPPPLSLGMGPPITLSCYTIPCTNTKYTYE